MDSIFSDLTDAIQKSIDDFEHTLSKIAQERKELHEFICMNKNQFIMLLENPTMYDGWKSFFNVIEKDRNSD